MNRVQARNAGEQPTPISNWATPKERPNSPANAPSDPGESPKSAVSPWATMAVVVRKAWLSANPLSSASGDGRPLSAGKDGDADEGGRGLPLTAARRTERPLPAR